MYSDVYLKYSLSEGIDLECLISSAAFHTLNTDTSWGYFTLRWLHKGLNALISNGNASNEINSQPEWPETIICLGVKTRHTTIKFTAENWGNILRRTLMGLKVTSSQKDHFWLQITTIINSQEAVFEWEGVCGGNLLIQSRKLHWRRTFL